MTEEHFEELLRGVLEEKAGVVPRGGLEGRVLARVATEGRADRRSRWLLFWGAGGVMTAILLAVAAGPGTGPTGAGLEIPVPRAALSEGSGERLPEVDAEREESMVRSKRRPRREADPRGRTRVGGDESRIAAQEGVQKVRVAELRIAPLEVAPLVVE